MQTDKENRLLFENGSGISKSLVQQQVLVEAWTTKKVPTKFMPQDLTVQDECCAVHVQLKIYLKFVFHT